MTPAARASSGLGVNIVHDVIIVRFAGNDYRVDTTRHVVEFEHMARLPRDVVIGARVIAGNPKTADDPTVGSVEGKATAKTLIPPGRRPIKKSREVPYCLGSPPYTASGLMGFVSS